MARLRFPGRPGFRFDRLGVRYGLEEHRRGLDQSTKLIQNVHSGLRYFRELFGESDEEEFEGFTEREIRKAEKNLTSLLGPLASPPRKTRLLRSDDSVPSISTSGHVDPKDRPPSKGAVADEETETPRATRGKVSLKELQKKLFKRGMAKPMKTSVGTKVRLLEQKRREKEKLNLAKQKAKGKGKYVKEAAKEEVPILKLKPIKIRLGSDGNQAKIVRGRGRPSIYDKDVEEKSAEAEAAKDESATGLTVDVDRDSEQTEESTGRVTRRQKRKVVVVPASKRVDKSVAKQLLNKAKKGASQSKREQTVPKEEPAAPVPTPVAVPPKEKPPVVTQHKPKGFVLPAVSSRSSRKIIPNKRFIEESFDYSTKRGSPSTKSDFVTPPKPKKAAAVAESANVSVQKKQTPPPPAPKTSPVAVPTIPPKIQVVPTTPPRTQETLVPDVKTSPLIIEGKRERRPSMKLIMKLSDDDAVMTPRKLENRKKIEEKKKSHAEQSESALKMTPGNIEQLQAAGFSETEIVTEMDDTEKTELLTLEQLERTAEATKRSGQNILRKAKLQLNRAALNRSKAALARSLKREMKKEEKKLAQQKGAEQLSVKAVGFGGFRSSQSILQQSPLKLTSFGQQGLTSISQVPKFSLEPACLPTSPLLGAGLAGTSTSGSPPGDAFLFPKEPSAEATPPQATPTQATPPQTTPQQDTPTASTSKAGHSAAVKGKEERIRAFKRDVCAVCTVDLTERALKKQTLQYYGVPCCAPCQWFYRRRLYQQAHENIDFKCPKDGKCNIFMEKRMCIGCRFRRCKEVLPEAQELLCMKKFSAKKTESETESELDVSAAEGETEKPASKTKVRKGKPEPGKEGAVGEEKAEKKKKKEKKPKKEKKAKEKDKEKKAKKKKSLEGNEKPSKKSPKKEGTSPGKTTAKDSPTKPEQVLTEGEKASEPAGVLQAGSPPSKPVISQPVATPTPTTTAPALTLQVSPTQSTQPQPTAGPSSAPDHEEPMQDDLNSDNDASSSDEYDEELAAILNSSRDSDMDFMFQAPFPVGTHIPSTTSGIPKSKPFSFGPREVLPYAPPGTSGGAGSSSESESDDSDMSESFVAPRGPRIKHVCRKVAVALGRPATFPARPSEIRLSALSQQAKQKLWKRDEQKRPGTPDSDDLSIEEIIRRARDHDDNVVHIKDNRAEPRKLKALAYRGSPSSKFRGSRHSDVRQGAFTSPGSERKYTKPESLTKDGKQRKRKMRCRECSPCRAKDCGHCVACKQMIKFGGTGTAKKACINRECRNPILPGMELPAHWNVSKQTKRESDDYGGEDPGGGGGGSGNHQGHGTRRIARRRRNLASKAETWDTDDIPGDDYGYKAGYEAGTGGGYGASVPMMGDYSRTGDPRRSPVAARRTNYIDRKLPVSAAGGQLQPRGLNKYNKERSDVVVLQSLVPASQRWAGGRDNYTIMADLRSNLDVDSAWRNGVPLVSSAPMCIRTVCFLCGSAGKEELVFCNVCCEPFHAFCLEERERPRLENLENWCCRRCQFCHVCGKQNNLLCCDKCQNTYHPECLGPNYPAKPSRHKNIWVCMKCVKCRSCGVTTPGTQPGSCWTHDFTLCYSCGHLTDKGNYCPLCKKCYADDDWDCKMIQCSSCESWVHAKCEGLTDEMYQVLSYLPEEVAYNCRVCLPVHPAPWEQTIRREIHAGIAAVISTMVVCKSTQHLHALEEEQPEAELKSGPGGFRRAPTPPPQRDLDIENGPLPMEELDPGVLAAAEDLLQQVCEAEEEALKKENQSTDVEMKPKVGSEKPHEVAALLTEDQPMETDSKDIENEQSDLNPVQNTTVKDTKPEPTLVPNEEEDANVPVCTDAMQDRRQDCDTKMSGALPETTAPSTCTKVDSCDSRTVDASGAKSDSVTNILPICDPVDPQSVVDARASNGGQAKETSTDSSGSAPTTRPDSPMETEESNQQSLSDLIKPCSIVLVNSSSVEKKLKSALAKTVHHREGVGRVVHFEDEKVDIDGDGALGSDGTQSIEERSPSATLTADEVAQDTLSDFGDLEVNKVPDYISLSAFMPVKRVNREAIHPKDLKDIKKRVVEKNYRTVEEFNDDIVRILQFNSKVLSEESSAPGYRKKAMKSVQTLFFKTMKECFPWFNVTNSRLWDHNKRLPDGMLEDAIVPPSSDHTYAQWMEKEDGFMSPQPSPFKRINPSPHRKVRVPMASLDEITDGSRESTTAPASAIHYDDGEDTRRCVLCSKVGDDETDDAGRLVYAGQDDWVHMNCALWSAEVFEEENHTLQNAHTALNRGRQLKCDYCSLSGATVGCCCRGCSSNYHFMCARKQRCIFQEDKKVFCRNHWDMMDSELVENNRFGVLRRSCIDTREIKWYKKQWTKGLNPNAANVLIGSMTVENLGRLSPLSDTLGSLIPIDFCSTRVFWSTVDARRRCVYTCRVILVVPSATTTSKVVVKDMTVVHDEKHPEYDPAKVTELEEMMKRQRPPPKKRKRRKSILSMSGESESDSEDEDYSPSEEEEEEATPSWRTVGKPVGRPAGRPLGIKQASHNTVPMSFQRATCGNGPSVRKEPRQAVMTPLPGGAGLNQNPPSGGPTTPATNSGQTAPADTKKQTENSKVPRKGPSSLLSTKGKGPKPVLGLNMNKKPQSTLSDEMLERLGQDQGMSDDNEYEDVDMTSGQHSQGSFFMKTVDINKTTHKRRLSQDSSASESDASSVIGGKQLKELFSQNHANTLGDKLDIIIGHLGTSKEMEAPILQNQLEKLQNHISTNKTDQETSDRVTNLLQQVPDILSEKPEEENVDIGRVSPLKNISSEIGIILEKVTDILNKSVSESDNTESPSKPQSEPPQGDQELGLLGAETKDKAVLENDARNTSTTADLMEDDALGLGLTPEELAAAESAMIKAQVDGKHDSDEEVAPDGKAPDGTVKSYPLRRTAARAAEASVQQQKLAAGGGGGRRGSDADRRGGEENSLADKIALRIKAESLARSAPSEDGPFKCPTCKRIYRTKESYVKHLTNCDYYVSSEDDEEDEEANSMVHGDDEWSPEKEEGSEPSRGMRLRDNASRRSLRGQLLAAASDNNTGGARRSLSRDRKDSKDETTEKVPAKLPEKRGRGRPPKQARPSTPPAVKRGPGRPRLNRSPEASCTSTDTSPAKSAPILRRSVGERPVDTLPVVAVRKLRSGSLSVSDTDQVDKSPERVTKDLRDKSPNVVTPANNDHVVGEVPQKRGRGRPPKRRPPQPADQKSTDNSPAESTKKEEVTVTEKSEEPESTANSDVTLNILADTALAGDSPVVVKESYTNNTEASQSNDQEATTPRTLPENSIQENSEPVPNESSQIVEETSKVEKEIGNTTTVQNDQVVEAKVGEPVKESNDSKQEQKGETAVLESHAGSNSESPEIIVLDDDDTVSKPTPTISQINSDSKSNCDSKEATDIDCSIVVSPSVQMSQVTCENKDQLKGANMTTQVTSNPVVIESPSSSEPQNPAKKEIGRTEITINFNEGQKAEGTVPTKSLTWKWSSDAKTPANRNSSPISVSKIMNSANVQGGAAPKVRVITLGPKGSPISPALQQHIVQRQSGDLTVPSALKMTRIISSSGNLPSHVQKGRVIVANAGAASAFQQRVIKPSVAPKKSSPATNVIDLNDLFGSGWKDNHIEDAKVESEMPTTQTVEVQKIPASTTVVNSQPSVSTSRISPPVCSENSQLPVSVHQQTLSNSTPTITERGIQALGGTKTGPVPVSSVTSPVVPVTPLVASTASSYDIKPHNETKVTTTTRETTKSPVICQLLTSRSSDVIHPASTALQKPTINRVKITKPNILSSKGPTTLSTTPSPHTVKTVMRISQQSGLVKTVVSTQEATNHTRMPNVRPVAPTPHLRPATPKTMSMLQDTFNKPLMSSRPQIAPAVTPVPHRLSTSNFPQQFSTGSSTKLSGNVAYHHHHHQHHHQHHHHQPQLESNTVRVIANSQGAPLQGTIDLTSHCQNVFVQNNQIITVVSGDTMPRLQDAPLGCVSGSGLINQGVGLVSPSSGLLSQSALVQAGLIPNAAYLQHPTQALQLQTVNVLPGQQTILSTSAPVVGSSQLCLHPQMSYVTSTANIISQPVVQQNFITQHHNYATVLPPAQSPHLTSMPLVTSNANIVPTVSQVLQTPVSSQMQSLMPSMFKNPMSVSVTPTASPGRVVVTPPSKPLPPKHSKSDQIILQELTGRKMDIKGDALDSAATSILSTLINEQVSNASYTTHPMRSILSTKPVTTTTSVLSMSQVVPTPVQSNINKVTSPNKSQRVEVKTISNLTSSPSPSKSSLIEIKTVQNSTAPSSNQGLNLEKQASSGLPTTASPAESVPLKSPTRAPDTIIRFNTGPGATVKEETIQGPDKKIRYRKIIRKKIIIRKSGTLKRKLSEGQVTGPSLKRPCFLVDKNGVVHGSINSQQALQPISPKPVYQQITQNPQIGQVMKVGPPLMSQLLKEKRKPKFKLPPRKYTKTVDKLRYNPNFKVNPKLLKVSYTKENQADVRDEVLKRKKARKQFLQERKDINNRVQQSHPLIHPHLQHPMLPQPEMEEEVVAVPSIDTYSQDTGPRQKQRHPKDVPHLVFDVTSDDGFHVRSDSCHDAWKAVTDRVQDARANARLKQLSYSGVNGMTMFGLVQNSVVYLLEQLYGAQHCTNYRFKFHDYRGVFDEPVVENPSGCARGEPFHHRKSRDMFSFLLSKYRPLPKQDLTVRDEDLSLKSQRRATSMELPMAMRFRYLRLHAKEAVGVYRSPIHGRGLFCKRNIDGGEMIIEYAGEVIRSIVTDKREQYYESKGIGCYMFRIDDGEVVDATVHGNAARFINHCCEPNCYSRVINVENKKHIIIFALRPIKKGEELTYDYKFPIEEVKIPCTCNARRCRKYLN